MKMNLNLYVKRGVIFEMFENSGKFEIDSELMKKFFHKIKYRRKRLKKARTMENLSKVLSQERPVLMGLLQKYTNVMKGKLKYF